MSQLHNADGTTDGAGSIRDLRDSRVDHWAAMKL